MQLQLHRYNLVGSLHKNYFTSKTLQFKKILNFTLVTVFVRAGLYKLNALLPEHGMILSSLTAKPSTVSYQFHGKRQKKTVEIRADIFNKHIWLFLDKFLHEFITHMYEFPTPTSKKYKEFTNTFNLRVRQKTTSNEDFADIIEDSMYDTHRGVYLPLMLHVVLSQQVTHFYCELYLRMLRLPVRLFNRLKRPAFDDKLILVGMDWLYREYRYFGKGGKMAV